MEPYNKKEPFISMKLDGSLLDRLVEAGIPLTRALQYFRDNPEGPASETAKLVAEETVPFYYNYRNNGDLSDYAKEAVILGMPIKGKYGKYEVDVPRTKAINEKLINKANELEKLAKEEPLSYAGHQSWTLKRLAQEGPMPYDTYRDLRNNFEWYKPLDEEWRNIIVSDVQEPRPTRYSVDIMPEHKLYNNKANFGAVNPSVSRTLNFPTQYPTGYDADFLVNRYKDKNVQTYLPEPGFKDYSFTAGEFEDALRERSNAARLYRDDFDSPYRYMGPYETKVRGMRGLNQEQRQSLLDLNREFEQVLLDQTLDETTKRTKLNALKQEIGLLEILGEIE